MPYLFATEDQDFSDFASGRVIYSMPGLPAFPVRLADEIFRRALQRAHPGGRVRLYDPCCGGAYHLAALGFLHGNAIEMILASDVDEQALELARRNLRLLTPPGLAQREQEIRRMLAGYGKASHADALKSLEALRQRLDPAHPVAARVFQANALEPAAVQHGLDGASIDLVISDIPYGLLSRWTLSENSPGAPSGPVEQMLESLYPALSARSLVAIAADKGQKITHPAYQRVERFQIGKRKVVLLQPQKPAPLLTIQ